MFELGKDELGKDEGDQTDVDVLFDSVKTVLKLDDLAAASVIEQGLRYRHHLPESADLLVAVDEVQEVLSADEKAKVEEHLESARSTEADDVALRQLIRSVRAKSSKKQSKKRKPITYKSKASWEVAQAQEMFPPDYRVYKDMFNKCWRCFFKRLWSSSKSWGISGEDDPCVRHCLEQAWRHHTSLTGEECPIQFPL